MCKMPDPIEEQRIDHRIQPATGHGWIQYQLAGSHRGHVGRSCKGGGNLMRILTLTIHEDINGSRFNVSQQISLEVVPSAILPKVMLLMIFQLIIQVVSIKNNY